MSGPRKDRQKSDKGRPYKEINWDLVDDLLIAGCSGTEIAPHFDMHPHTFYDRVFEEKKMLFTDYSLQKKCKGDSILRHVQYKKAIKGDNTQLIWLGKNRLGQRDSADVSIAEDTVKAFSSVMDYFAKMQQPNQSKEESPSQ